MFRKLITQAIYDAWTAFVVVDAIAYTFRTDKNKQNKFIWLEVTKQIPNEYNSYFIVAEILCSVCCRISW